jgi:hypothetical protein
MPRECLDCKFVSLDDDASQCDRCGGVRLRFSVLAGMKFRERKAEAVKAKLGADDRPTAFDRLGQTAKYLLFSQAAAFILIGAAIFATPNDEVPKAQSLSKLIETVAEVYPGWIVGAAIVIPAFAAAVGVVFALRNVYLAQQMGLILAPISALTTLAWFVALGGPPVIIAWLVSPVLAAGLAFVAGLRMTGFIKERSPDETKSIEYKPVDSWERDAKPKFFILRIAERGRFGKLMWGLAAGGAATHLLPFLLAAMSGATAGEMSTARTAFAWLGVVVAGAFAAAGTKAPFLQGMMAGFLMFFIRRYANLFVFTPETLVQLWVHAMVGVAGGFAGRYFFPPPRVVRGRERCASDHIVYVGDELVKNSA